MGCGIRSSPRKGKFILQKKKKRTKTEHIPLFSPPTIALTVNHTLLPPKNRFRNFANFLLSMQCNSKQTNRAVVARSGQQRRVAWTPSHTVDVVAVRRCIVGNQTERRSIRWQHFRILFFFFSRKNEPVFSTQQKNNPPTLATPPSALPAQTRERGCRHCPSQSDRSTTRPR